MKNNFINKIDKIIIEEALNNDFTLIDTELESLGYSIGEINEASQKMFKRESFKLKAMINIKKDENLLEKALNLLENAIQENIEKPINYLKGIIQSNQFQVQYRNLDKLTKEEIIDIIKDQNLLELIEKLEDED